MFVTAFVGVLECSPGFSFEWGWYVFVFFVCLNLLVSYFILGYCFYGCFAMCLILRFRCFSGCDLLLVVFGCWVVLMVCFLGCFMFYGLCENVTLVV